MSEARGLTTRDVLLAAAGGAAAAAIGHVLGRAVRLGVGVPMAGSLVAALPRTAVLLVVLARARGFGVLPRAGVAEGVLSLGLGGLFPLCVAGPVVAGACADAAWRWGRGGGERGGLMLSGAVLAAARMVAVLVLIVALGLRMGSGGRGVGAMAAAIVVGNFLLGGAAGLLASRVTRELRQAGVMG